MEGIHTLLSRIWGQCKRNLKPTTQAKEAIGQRRAAGGQWQDPLYLVLGDGRRFRLEFDCKKCEMKVHTSTP